MEKKNDVIGLTTPGGDASGINACIRAVVRLGISEGYRIVGIQNGYQGIYDGKFVQLNKRSVSGIINLGGTILKSARCKEIRSEQGIKKAAALLKREGVDKLIVIGGDGSSDALLKLSSYGIQGVAIPASIDNDINGTDETIGFDTATDVAVDAVDKIRDTATSFDRVFIVEVMGRNHGFLALSVGIASGAEFIIVPEVKYNLRKICAELLYDKRKGKSSEIIIFAEGAGDVKKFAENVASTTNLEVRVSTLGYIQRGGTPSARSRNLGARFGAEAVKLIKQKKFNRLVVIRDSIVGSIPLTLAKKHEKRFDYALHKLAKQLSD
ncbi:MAG: ATP-dependent 6-phosphofructokinase [Elusimicrobiota bacterium]